MLGTVVRRKRGDRRSFRIVGREGGQLVLGPLEHGPAVSVSELELRELFTVEAEAPATHATPTPQTGAVAGRAAGEQAAWEALTAEFVRSISAARTRPMPPTPEETFRAAEEAS